MTKDTYIFDLDGTIANIDARRKLCVKPNGKMNFQKFFDPRNIDLDTPNDPVIQTLQTLHKAGFKIVIFSGRSKATKQATVKWLDKFNVPYHVLKMRPTSHPFAYMKDDLLKKHWLDNIFPGDEVNRIISVFDDRDQVVTMWRENNIPCFQVAPGNF
jgi:FMN phosphatase YigB (HAD superfamily)